MSLARDTADILRRALPPGGLAGETIIKDTTLIDYDVSWGDAGGLPLSTVPGDALVVGPIPGRVPGWAVSPINGGSF